MRIPFKGTVLSCVGLCVSLIGAGTTVAQGFDPGSSTAAPQTVVAGGHEHHHHLAEVESEAENPSPEPSTYMRSVTLRVTPRSLRSPYALSSSIVGPRFQRQVHLFELPGSNRILSCAGSGNEAQRNAARQFVCDVYDWSTGERITLNLPDDWFCGAGIYDEDGSLIFSGGTALDGYPALSGGQWHGSASTYRFDPTTLSITKLADMNEPRWYNNLVRNWFSNDIYTFGGLDSGAFSSTWEVMKPGTDSWELLPWYRENYSYDDFKVVDANHLAFTGASQTRSNRAPYILDIRNNMQTNLTGFRRPAHRRSSASIALYPAQAKRVAVFGGGGGGTLSTNLVDIVDYSVFPRRTPTYTPGANMPAGVMFVLASNLPNGQVFVTGGTRKWRTGSVLWAALYTPWTDSWTRLRPAKVARSYHSNIYTRLDGRIVTFGGNPRTGEFESRSEIFTPWYKFRPAPRILAAPAELEQGRAYRFQVKFPRGTKLGKVTLDSPRSTTHSASDTGYGLFRLPATQTRQGVRVTVPQGDIIPTGWYKLSVVTGGRVTKQGVSGQVPSARSVWVQVTN